MQSYDYELLLNPRAEPSPAKMRLIDGLSWALPAIAATLSIFAGATAWWHLDQWAAGLSILGGFLGALAVLFANWSSRIRDQRLAHTTNLSQLATDIAGDLQGREPPWF